MHYFEHLINDLILPFFFTISSTISGTTKTVLIFLQAAPFLCYFFHKLPFPKYYEC